MRWWIAAPPGLDIGEISADERYVQLYDGLGDSFRPVVDGELRHVGVAGIHHDEHTWVVVYVGRCRPVAMVEGAIGLVVVWFLHFKGVHWIPIDAFRS